MQYPTSDLDGAPLDAAVAAAERRTFRLEPDPARPGARRVLLIGDDGAPIVWTPSTDWSLGGPIVEREHIDLGAPEPWAQDRRWFASVLRGASLQEAVVVAEARGATPLIAAMRAYVIATFGAEVELPAPDDRDPA